MKKIYFLLVAVFFAWQGNAQILNQNAAWPNPAWTVTGTYSVAAGAFEANPTTTANFAWDDDDAGQTSIDNIAAESPVINLTAAVAGGESKVRVSAPHTYRILAGYLRFEYWDADAAAWQPWGADLAGNNTTVNNNFCTPAKTLYTTSDLDVSGFTATQKSGFKYRIAFDDLDWEWGFCFDSPTIISVPAPCLSGTNYPTGTLTITTDCDGVTPTLIATDSYAGDYYNMNVTLGQTYKYTSSTSTDYYTISTDNDLTAAAAGVQPFTWVSTVTGTIRVHINTNITCGVDPNDRTTTVICGVPCLNGTGPYPTATYTPATCDGATVNTVATDSWAGEYSNIQMFSTNTYTIASSVATDYITVANAAGTTALAIGTGSLTFTPTADGVYRVYFHLDSACGTENVAREKTIVCTTSATVPDCVSNPSPADGATGVPAFGTFNLTWDAPTTGSAPLSYNVYGGTNPAALNLIANTTDTFLNGVTVGGYDTLIYWQVVPTNAAGEAVGCVVWSFTTESAPAPPANDECTGAIALTPGGDFSVNPVNGTVLGATTDAAVAPSCAFNNQQNSEVWYTVVVPASGSLTIETQASLANSLTDTTVAAFSGTCGSLTEIDCNDDASATNLMSLLSLTGLTPGDTLYIGVWKWGTATPTPTVNEFVVSAYDGSLANETFTNETFQAYPNPVKDVLNLAYTQNIEKVQVVNLLGQEVIAKAINATQSQIDMSSLPVGTYLVKVTADGLVKTIKVIKE
jgi:hypothetical protein